MTEVNIKKLKSAKKVKEFKKLIQDLSEDQIQALAQDLMAEETFEYIDKLFYTSPCQINIEKLLDSKKLSGDTKKDFETLLSFYWDFKPDKEDRCPGLFGPILGHLHQGATSSKLKDFIRFDQKSGPGKSKTIIIGVPFGMTDKYTLPLFGECLGFIPYKERQKIFSWDPSGNHITPRKEGENYHLYSYREIPFIPYNKLKNNNEAMEEYEFYPRYISAEIILTTFYSEYDFYKYIGKLSFENSEEKILGVQFNNAESPEWLNSDYFKGVVTRVMRENEPHEDEYNYSIEQILSKEGIAQENALIEKLKHLNICPFEFRLEKLIKKLKKTKDKEKYLKDLFHKEAFEWGGINYFSRD